MKKIKNQVITIKTNFLILPLLLSLTILFCASSVSAADGDIIYVNNNIGDDSYDGFNSIYDPITNHGPKLSIKNATGTVNTDGTVQLADGGYTGVNNTGITIDRSMKIIGESQSGTVINAQRLGRIFRIEPGITVTLENITLANGESSRGGQIWNRGTLNLINCTLTGGRADGGGSIQNTGVLNVTDCTFTGNDAAKYRDGGDYKGGAILNYGTLIINNSTFTGNYACYGGAIENYCTFGTTTADITNCTFTGNYLYLRTPTFDFGGGGEGGAIYNHCNYGTINVNLTNCTFTRNEALCGGAICSFSEHSGSTINLNLNNCTFTDNRVGFDSDGLGGLGGAIKNTARQDGTATLTVINSTFTGTSIEYSALYGGAIFNSGVDGGNAPLTVIGSTFKDNKVTFFDLIGAGGLGGAICNEADYSGIANMDITDSTFTGNYASYGGGAIFTHALELGTSIAHVNFNRFFGNTLDPTYGHGTTICKGTYGTVDADNNWWGTNTPDFSQLLYQIPDPDSWLVMNAIANPLSIQVGDTSTVTATIESYNKNSGLYSPVVHCAPIPAIFTATLGNMDPESTLIIPNLGIDQVKSIFTSTQQGTAALTAKVDDETVAFSIQADITPTTLTVGDVVGCYGNTATFTAILKNDLGQPVVGEEVNFSVDLGYIGHGTTDNTGTATLNYPLNFGIGHHAITAVFHDDIYKYLPSGGTGNLIVNINPTTTTVDNVHNFAGQNVNLVAHVVDSESKAVNSGQVRFTVGSATPIVANVVGGLATVTGWTIPSDWLPGTYNIVAEYLGNTNYTASTNTGVLTVDQTPTNVVVDNTHNFAGQNVNLVAHVTSPYGSVNEGLVRFTVIGPDDISVPVGDINVASGVASTTWTIQSAWNTGNHRLYAEYLGSPVYLGSLNSGTLTVDRTPTTLTVSDITSDKGINVDLKATLLDYYGNPVSGKSVTFKVNGVDVPGSAITGADGVATMPYTINLVGGTYNIEATFADTDTQYIGSTGTGSLKVPQSSVFVKTTVSNTNPIVGQTVTITFKLGNNGPDAAKNIVFTYVLPAEMELANLSGDNNYSYDPATRTITWKIDEVPAGTDPWLYANVRFLNAGNFNIKPTINLATYDPNINSNIQSVVINAKAVPVRVNAATVTGNGRTVTSGAAPYSPGTTPEGTSGNWLLSYWWIILLLLLIIFGALIWFLLATKQGETEG
ncbi:MAG: Ig-like domain repeat protein [Methanobacterium sp.]|uniref:hypothetical protein n=1 Tax=Methanobacterium sp. TaxID=2164 RepID=UPI003D661DD9|nr:Ig-like domain repeat protein [Methanobacterium sp.]